MSLKAVRVSMLASRTATFAESDSGLEVTSEDLKVTIMRGGGRQLMEDGGRYLVYTCRGQPGQRAPDDAHMIDRCQAKVAFNGFRF